MFVPLKVSEVKKLEQTIPWIVVPFRDNAAHERAEHLRKFASHIKRYHPDWHVLIVEQSDDGRKFNRGALLNIGARIAEKSGATYVVFHDVDLLPLAPIVPYYTVYPQSPIHIGKAWTTKYSHSRFLGGVVSMSIEDMKTTNGFPNQFWGWGGEDDALRERIFKKEIEIFQPEMRTGFRDLAHVHVGDDPVHVNLNKRRDVMNDTGRMGFRTVQWKVLAEEELTPTIKKISVELRD